jgi:UDP-N-acetylglucosamine kinase
MNKEQQQIRDRAIAFARKNKKVIARRLTNRDLYPPERDPVSVFMAGSPGAGKTEASIELLDFLRANEDWPVLRIDPDDLRSEFEDYQGDNSWLFQPAVSILVEKILDLAFKHHQSFLLDGTLTNPDLAASNIDRSLQKNRLVQILYVYQDPLLAWRFVKAREKAEGRNIRREDFIAQYFAARDVVNGLKERFGKNVSVDLLIKNLDGSGQSYKANIDRIDNHVPEKYTPGSLEKALSAR